MDLQRGTRGRLSQHFQPDLPIALTLRLDGPAVYDFSCFGVDTADKLSDDRYMVFYNQTASPAGEITYSATQNSAVFQLKLNALPAAINKLVFTASIDGSGTMQEISRHCAVLSQSGKELSLQLTGADFRQEKAIITLEIYRKDGEWRFNAVARGFNGGLDALLAAYGGEQADDATPAAAPPPAPKPAPAPQPAPAPAPAPPPAPAKISLEKKIEAQAPKLISLVKPLKVELKKRNLDTVIARVALVLDISGSMSERYSNGTVQEIINKTVPLAVQFDDDGTFDFWYYGSKCSRRPGVNMYNYERAVPDYWSDLMRDLGYGNNEPEVMREVIEEYKKSSLPAYVIFISDGGVSKADQIKQLIIESSQMPIFWQFVGVGGVSKKDKPKQEKKGFFSSLFSIMECDYGIFEEIDELPGRYVDNASFFAMDDFKTVPNDELYSRLLNEFPQWLQAARSKGILR